MPLLASAAVLQVIAAAEVSWADGIREQLHDATDGRIALSRGHLVPLLRKLAADGLLEPAGEEARADGGGKPRKLYRLTDAGRAAAEQDRRDMLTILTLRAERG